MGTVSGCGGGSMETRCRATGILFMLLAGCAGPRVQVTPEAAVVDSAIAPLLAPATDLSGGWTTGSANEPPAGPVQRHPSCAYNPPVWIIRQQGNALETWMFPESFNQGVASPNVAQKMPAIRGTVSGPDVVISGDAVRIVLRYDEASGHLRGTRNGAPFWAARQEIIRGACPGIPDNASGSSSQAASLRPLGIPEEPLRGPELLSAPASERSSPSAPGAAARR